MSDDETIPMGSFFSTPKSQPDYEGVSASELAMMVAGFLVFWRILHFGYATLFPLLAPAELKRLAASDPNFLRRSALYFNSTIHAAVITVVGFYKLINHDLLNVSGVPFLMSFVTSYFVNDFLETMPDWISHPSEFFHHVVALVLSIGASLTPHVHKFVPHFVIVEASTVFYNGMWLMQKTRNDKSPIYTVLSILFALTFFLVRVAWLPIYVFCLVKYHNDDFQNMGLARYGFGPITALQYYWFFLIVQKVRRVASAANRA